MTGDDHSGHDHGAHAHGAHKSQVYNPTGAPEEKIEQAMDACPASCIYWQE